jgi:hypothetical protein
MKQLQVALELSEDDSVIRSVNRVSLTLQLLHSIMQRISEFFRFWISSAVDYDDQ